MKKLLLSLSLVALATGAAVAQKGKTKKSPAPQAQAAAPAAAPATHSHDGHNDGHSHDGHSHDGHSHGAPATEVATSLTVDNMAFKADIHDFGTIAEGPAADHVFTFTNTGKEPLTIQRVQASCGCTTPEWTKDPIQPGQTGIVKASYGTGGRPGHFEKTLTVFSNAGTKTLTIKGDVEKAPESSAPQNTSMIRTN
jgi:hypothetical protein